MGEDAGHNAIDQKLDVCGWSNEPISDEHWKSWNGRLRAQHAQGAGTQFGLDDFSRKKAQPDTFNRQGFADEQTGAGIESQWCEACAGEPRVNSSLID